MPESPGPERVHPADIPQIWSFVRIISGPEPGWEQRSQIKMRMNPARVTGFDCVPGYSVSLSITNNTICTPTANRPNTPRASSIPTKKRSSMRFDGGIRGGYILADDTLAGPPADGFSEHDHPAGNLSVHVRDDRALQHIWMLSLRKRSRIAASIWKRSAYSYLISPVVMIPPYSIVAI